jgi:hypothetical protein
MKRGTGNGSRYRISFKKGIDLIICTEIEWSNDG